MDDLTTQVKPTYYFLGVTTGQSAGQRVFPIWANHLGLTDAQLVGVDLPLNAEPAAYRRFVQQIKRDPLSLGALITSHKINLLEAAADLFDTFTPEALLCNEVSCIYKEAGQLIGHVVEIKSFAVALEGWLGADYFARRRSNLLCLGAGGSATSLLAHVGTQMARESRPLAVTLVDRDPDRLAHKERLIAQLPQPNFTIHLVEATSVEVVDALVAAQPAGSLIVNATGMGKDLPGSPVSDAVEWPLEAAVWELNYRGELDFLHQAGRQMNDRGLRLQDGWTLFCGGWAATVEKVFGLSLFSGEFERLCVLALRGR